jgi:hypothetical protein
MPRVTCLVVVLSIVSPAYAQQPALATLTLAKGVPLHIRVTRTAKLRTGAPVEGVLTEPIYAHDRLVLPLGTVVRGMVSEYALIERQVRVQALLNGDVTPLHDPVVDFNSLHLTATGADVALHSRALIRNAQIVRFAAKTRKPSLYQQGKAMVKQRIAAARETVFGPNKKDRALRLLYSQLPYHPQRIWAGTQFIADLESPAGIDLPVIPPVLLADNPSLNGIKVTARLASTIDSLGARKGDEVTAIVTQPIFDESKKLVLPEGAELEGSVMQTMPARSFGRNGQLRFSFRGVKDGDVQPERKVFGTITGAEGASGQNLTVDAEGNVQANPDKNRFVAPLLLAVTAVAAHGDHDHHQDEDGGLGHTTVASNGFGLVARVIAITASNANVATGFGAYAFAKSIYFRFLTRGHEVTFPRDTLVEVTLSTR